jgi:1-acyl-sn-glycerol-3-phosphate acyltransferase
VIARLHPLAPIDAAGAHRRELAEAAQEAVGAALRRDM